MDSRWTGLLALAAAMGIGRFAFTPVLPLMQQAGALDLAGAGVLAGANYLGYLVGALACTVFSARPQAAARAGLAVVALATLAMAVPGSSFIGWSAMRFAAGAASACVFVGVASLSVSAPTYAGVGLGIAGAGLLALVVALAGASAATAWLALGGAAAVLAALAWRGFGEVPPAAPRAAAPAASGAAASRREQARLVACYGALGLGYILPATFLPAAARAVVPDPAVFGWTWPVFGAAAALSMPAAAPLLARWPARRVWAAAQAVMAAGVLAPVVAPGLAALVVAALAVGGTFMVVTLAGMQEARRVAGAGAPRLVGAMTTAFAAGQVVGPLLVRGDALALPSLVAAAALAASTAALLWPASPSSLQKGSSDERSDRPHAAAGARADGRRPEGCCR